MALIIRGGCEFFIRSVRRGGRVTSEYVGSGELAWLADARAQNLKAEREDRRRKLAARLARWDRVAAAVEAYGALIDHLFRLAMEAAGYHQHKRGEWRKQRMSTTAQLPAESADLIKSLRARVAEGDNTALPALSEAIAKARELVPFAAIPAEAYDPGQTAERAVIRWAAEKDPTAREAIRKRLDQFRAELAGSEPPTVLERLLIDRLALCWLDVNTWDERLARADPHSFRMITMEFVDHLERRRGAAHQRFNRAVKALATFRRLALPRIKVRLSVEDRSDRIPLPPVNSID
jgi:hypothetical protein